MKRKQSWSSVKLKQWFDMNERQIMNMEPSGGLDGERTMKSAALLREMDKRARALYKKYGKEYRDETETD